MQGRMEVLNFKMTTPQLKSALELYDNLMEGKQTLLNEMIELKRLVPQRPEAEEIDKPVALTESQLKKLIRMLKNALNSKYKDQAQRLKNEIFKDRENVFENLPTTPRPGIFQMLTPITEDAAVKQVTQFSLQK
jgi:hypothetical protein